MHSEDLLTHPKKGIKKDDIELNELWGGVRSGKKEALEHLYALFYRQLYFYGLKIVPREALIKDSIQELFLTLWEKRFSIAKAHSVKAYLYQSFRRLIFRKLQREKNRQQRNWDYVDSYEQTPKNIEELILKLELKKEEKSKLNRCLSILSDRQKEAIQLKYENGFSNDEIALLMNINKQSVYNHISQAISKLQMAVKN